MPPAFLSPSPLVLRLPRRPRGPYCTPRLPLTVAKSPPPATPTTPAPTAPRRVTLFSTGQPLTLSPAPATLPSSTPLYILCPTCPTAYLANALTAPLTVRCPRCSGSFLATPGTLFQHTASTAASPPAPSPPPDSIVCPHFSDCPGCSLSTRVSSPPVLSHAAGFLQRALHHAPGFASVSSGASHGWRTHAKLAVRRTGGSGPPRVGLFRARSHDLVPIPSCAVHHPALNEAARAVEVALDAAHVSAYNDVTGHGDCRYVLLTLHRPSGTVQVTLVWNAGNWKGALPSARNAGAALWKGGHARKLHSVWFNWNRSGGNAIVAPGRGRFYHMHGAHDLVESVCGVQFAFQPFAFRQANLDAFETLLLPKLLEYVPRGARVAEFCAGVGVIGLVALKERGLRRLYASEINAAAEELFWQAVRGMDKDGARAAAEVRYVVGSDEDTADMVDGETEVVIVDPPRGGLSEGLVQFLARPDGRDRLHRVIYVSCGFEAFQRDSRALVDSGEWKVHAAHAMVLFPGSDHVEILCVFDRVAAGRQGAGRLGAGRQGAGRDVEEGGRRRRKGRDGGGRERRR